KGAHLRKLDPSHYISDFEVRTNSKGFFSNEVKVEGNKKKPFSVEVEVIDRKNHKSIKHESLITGPSEFIYPEPSLWTPDEPNLYDVIVKRKHQNKVVETIRSYAGFSDFTQKNGH